MRLNMYTCQHREASVPHLPSFVCIACASGVLARDTFTKMQGQLTWMATHCCTYAKHQHARPLDKPVPLARGR